jgi:hypothetical protein
VPTTTTFQHAEVLPPAEDNHTEYRQVTANGARVVAADEPPVSQVEPRH